MKEAHAIIKTKLTYILCFALSCISISCHKMRREAHGMVSKTKEKIKDKAENTVDKVLPTFDAYKPDTKFNKRRFKEFLEIDPSEDVKNIYCFDDAIGIDADYEFAFECKESTINKIVKKLNLAKTVKDSAKGISFGPNLPWWDTAKISKIDPYWKKGPHETYWYLWFDKNTKNAYFMTFDM